MSSTTAVTPAATSSPAPAPPAKETGTSFRDALAANDRTVAVKGHGYRKVTAGEHEGAYQNRTGNARDGQLFQIVRRDGRQFHVYGTGAERSVVEVVRKDAPTGGTSAAGTTAPGTTAASTAAAGGVQAG